MKREKKTPVARLMHSHDENDEERKIYRYTLFIFI